MPSKNEVVNNLMDRVLLLASANMELNVLRREALRPELHASYRYLCAPSNPISSELFGDDLPIAVKDITDNNRISSKLQRDKKRVIEGVGNLNALTNFRGKGTTLGQKTTFTPPNTRGRGRRNSRSLSLEC